MTRKDVATLAQAYLAKPENSIGGNLHIVLADKNLEDHCVQFCLESAKRLNDLDGIILAEAILQLSMTQRRKLYANNWR